MKQTFEILNNPDQVALILRSLRKDSHLAKTFEGTAKNGLLEGFYTNLALINGSVIGYVKIRGKYDHNNGDLKLEVIPSYLYWTIMIAAIVGFALFTFNGIAENTSILIGSGLFFFLGFIWTIAFVLEARNFIKHINRIGNL